MSRDADLREAARWAMREDDETATEAPPPAAADIQAVLDDPALTEAMGSVAALGRLSDGDVRQMRAARRQTLGTIATVAVVFTAGLAGWQTGWFAPTGPVPQHYETKPGERMTVQLADGTTIQLGGDTSLDVVLGRSERHVDLRSGEAFFDVAHAADHPFTVSAQGSNTQVLGTAFNLDILGGDVRLAVYRGKVRFGDAETMKQPFVVSAGWRSRYSEGVAHKPVRFDATQQNWGLTWLDVDDMRLSQLVEAINRRGGPLVDAPPGAIANIPLSGRFKLDNPQQLLSAIGAVYGFKVIREENALRLIATGQGDK